MGNQGAGDTPVQDRSSNVAKVCRNMTFWVLCMALAGYALALLFGDKAWLADAATLPPFYDALLTIKELFIKLLRLLVAPVVFISIVAGLVNLRSITHLQRLGFGTLAYYLLTTAIAVMLGLFTVLYVHPWEGGAVIAGAGIMDMASGPGVDSLRFIDSASSSLGAVFMQLLERTLVNPFAAFYQLNVLAIVCYALLTGFALALLVPEQHPLLKVVDRLSRGMHRVLGWVIWLTPIGVFAIMFDFALRIGGAIVDQLFWFALVVFAVTAVHSLIVLPGIAWLASGIPPWQLWRRTAQPMLVAFTTASSTATLPVTIKSCQDDLGVSRPVAGFVLPLGATMNMDGTALFEGVAAVFLAYLFGVELSEAAMVAVFVMAMVSSIGAPGMPSGSMSGMQMVLLAVGIPLEAIAILLVVERPLDTFRTAVNVQGDMVGTLVVERLLKGRKAVTAAEGFDAQPGRRHHDG